MEDGNRKSAGNLSDNDLPKVSVLLPVRNESENISSFIQSLQSQNYPAEKVEWIVIDDHIEDDTWKKLSLLTDPDCILSAYKKLPIRGRKLRLQPACMQQQVNGSLPVMLTVRCQRTGSVHWLRKVLLMMR
ncbi:MAG: glycosyltransferase [Bacteroidetes bacterium]|nr:glycosyltransferase [Bacteroidota bacterium]